MSQYTDVFLDEGREQLANLETSILQMEGGDHGVEILQTIFRSAHSLKGASRAMGFLAIGDLTHEMENVLDDLRNAKFGVTTPVINILLECLDSLTVLVDSVSATGGDAQTPGRDIPDLVARLNALRGASAAPSADEAEETQVGAARVASGIVVSEFEQASIKDALESGLSVQHIRIALDSDCMLKSVRVFMVLDALGTLGTVLIASPGEDELEAENFELAFELIFATDQASEAVQAAIIDISEIDKVTVSPWEAAAPARQQEAAPLAPLLPAPEIAATPPVLAEKPAPAAEATPAKLTSETAPKSAAAHSPTIRVDVTRLDALLNLVGELVIDRTQIARLGEDLHARYPQDDQVSHLVEATHRVARITAELQDEIMKTRMLPIDGVFQRMPRMIRDLAQKTGKEVDFQMSGGETELDRSVLEVLGDPLIHLLRNSVDHGVEPPDERVAAGKPPTGIVTLSARHEGNQIVIDITDDGRGMDPAKLKAAAVRKNLITEQAAAAMSDRDALHLIFASGFSTAQVLSDISGRGVGMDIVKSNLEKLGGRVALSSELGEGSRFTIYLPLTLAIVRALLVTAGTGTYVLPLGSVVEMLQLGTSERESEGAITRGAVGGNAVLMLRGRTIPLVNMLHLLAGNPSATHADQIAANAYVVVVGWAEKQIGLCVDALQSEQEVVIKSLGALLGDMRGISGATILGDGRVGLIVDPARAMECLDAPQEAKASR